VIGLRIFSRNVKDLQIIRFLSDAECQHTMRTLTAQYISSSAPNAAEQKAWTDHSSTVGLLLFKAAFSAPTVKRFYADFPAVDECSFHLATNAYDDFGQPTLKDVFSFSLNRTIYSKNQLAAFHTDEPKQGGGDVYYLTRAQRQA
jgi:hypothetical protein